MITATDVGNGLVWFGGLVSLVGVINGILFGREGFVYQRRWEIVLAGGAVATIGLYILIF